MHGHSRRSSLGSSTASPLPSSRTRRASSIKNELSFFYSSTAAEMSTTRKPAFTTDVNTWVVDPRNFALALVQRLGYVGLAAVEEAFRKEGNFGLQFDRFVDVLYTVVREVERVHPSQTFPWMPPRSESEKHFLTNDDAESRAYDLLHEAMIHKPRIDVEHERFPTKSKTIHARQDEQQSVWAQISATRRCPSESMDYFSTRILLKFSLAVLFDAVDEHEKNIIAWEHLGAYLYNVVKHSSLQPHFGLLRDMTSAGSFQFSKRKIAQITKIRPVPWNNHVLCGMTNDTLARCDPTNSLRKFNQIDVYSKGRVAHLGPLVSFDAAENTFFGRIVCASFLKGPVRLYNAMDGRQQHLLELDLMLPQTHVFYCSALGAMLLGGRTGRVRGLDVLHHDFGMKFEFQRQHSAHVTDMMYLKSEGYLATTSVDCSMILHDAHTRECVDVYRGRRPITSIAHIQYMSASPVIVSVGVDPVPVAWDIRVDPSKATFFLNDAENHHQHKIVRVLSVPHTPQVFTLDKNGKLNVWDVRMQKCTQSLFATDPRRQRADSIEYTDMYLDGDRTLYLSNTNGVEWFQERSGEDAKGAVSTGGGGSGGLPESGQHTIACFAHSPKHRLFLTIAGRDIKLWDDRSCVLQSTHSHVCEQNISAAALNAKDQNVVFLGTVDGNVAICTFPELKHFRTVHVSTCPPTALIAHSRGVIVCGSLLKWLPLISPTPLSISPITATCATFLEASSHLVVGSQSNEVYVFSVTHVPHAAGVERSKERRDAQELGITPPVDNLRFSHIGTFNTIPIADPVLSLCPIAFGEREFFEEEGTGMFVWADKVGGVHIFGSTAPSATPFVPMCNFVVATPAGLSYPSPGTCLAFVAEYQFLYVGTQVGEVLIYFLGPLLTNAYPNGYADVTSDAARRLAFYRAKLDTARNAHPGTYVATSTRKYANDVSVVQTGPAPAESSQRPSRRNSSYGFGSRRPSRSSINFRAPVEVIDIESVKCLRSQDDDANGFACDTDEPLAPILIHKFMAHHEPITQLTVNENGVLMSCGRTGSFRFWSWFGTPLGELTPSQEFAVDVVSVGFDDVPRPWGTSLREVDTASSSDNSDDDEENYFFASAARAARLDQNNKDATPRQHPLMTSQTAIVSTSGEFDEAFEQVRAQFADLSLDPKARKLTRGRRRRQMSTFPHFQDFSSPRKNKDVLNNMGSPRGLHEPQRISVTSPTVRFSDDMSFASKGSSTQRDLVMSVSHAHLVTKLRSEAKPKARLGGPGMVVNAALLPAKNTTDTVANNVQSYREESCTQQQQPPSIILPNHEVSLRDHLDFSGAHDPSDQAPRSAVEWAKKYNKQVKERIRRRQTNTPATNYNSVNVVLPRHGETYTSKTRTTYHSLKKYEKEINYDDDHDAGDTAYMKYFAELSVLGGQTIDREQRSALRLVSTGEAPSPRVGGISPKLFDCSRLQSSSSMISHQSSDTAQDEGIAKWDTSWSGIVVHPSPYPTHAHHDAKHEADVQQRLAAEAAAKQYKDDFDRRQRALSAVNGGGALRSLDASGIEPKEQGSVNDDSTNKSTTSGLGQEETCPRRRHRSAGISHVTKSRFYSQSTRWGGGVQHHQRPRHEYHELLKVREGEEGVVMFDPNRSKSQPNDDEEPDPHTTSRATSSMSSLKSVSSHVPFSRVSPMPRAQSATFGEGRGVSHNHHVRSESQSQQRLQQRHHHVTPTSTKRRAAGAFSSESLGGSGTKMRLDRRVVEALM